MGFGLRCNFQFGSEVEDEPSGCCRERRMNRSWYWLIVSKNSKAIRGRRLRESAAFQQFLCNCRVFCRLGLGLATSDKPTTCQCIYTNVPWTLIIIYRCVLYVLLLSNRCVILFSFCMLWCCQFGVRKVIRPVKSAASTISKSLWSIIDIVCLYSVGLYTHCANEKAVCFYRRLHSIRESNSAYRLNG